MLVNSAKFSGIDIPDIGWLSEIPLDFFLIPNITVKRLQFVSFSSQEVAWFGQKQNQMDCLEIRRPQQQTGHKLLQICGG